MNAYELPGVKLRLEAADRLAQKVRLLARVNRDVVALGLDPVDLVRVEEEDAPARLDDDPLAVTLLPVHLFEQSEYARVDAVAVSAFAPDLPLGAVYRRTEPLAVERLQKVVERVILECTHGVGGVCGDEDDGRKLFALERFEHVEASDLWHLHVEQNQVGAHRLD